MSSRYGYIPESPLAEFWREHDARQRAMRARRHYRHAEIVWAITMSADSPQEYQQQVKEIYP
jgi:hypothetical protein